MGSRGYRSIPTTDNLIDTRNAFDRGHNVHEASLNIIDDVKLIYTREYLLLISRTYSLEDTVCMCLSYIVILNSLEYSYVMR